MTITYEFRTNYTIFDIMSIAFLMISFISLILVGRSLQRRKKINIPHYFVYIGCACLAWTIVSLLIPTMTGTWPLTDQETQETFIFLSLFYSLIPNLIYFSTLGWMMRSIGMKNAEFQGKKLVLVGILMMGSYFMMGIISEASLFNVLYFSPESSQIYIFFSLIGLGINILILIAAAIFLKFSIDVKEGMLLISSSAFLMAKVISFLIYFNLLISIFF